MKNLLIMGAAGRDFHNFNMLYRDDPEVRVLAFTASQIPFISKRVYPSELAGPLYPEGIPIYPEEKLEELIKDKDVDTVVFSYSDVSHEHVMHRASLATALNANFLLVGSERSMLHSGLPVISVSAVRTGCGKSGVTRLIAKAARDLGADPVVIRHPMPYGDLAAQCVQRFASLDDIKNAKCTIEEREEYEPLLTEGLTVFAGVDYAKILAAAEAEAGLIIWDGGNNDTPFIKPDLEIVVADPLRPGHELSFYPGESNLRRAGVIVINKADSADPASVAIVRNNINAVNPGARIMKTASVLTVDAPIEEKDVLVVEDGPTLTHGGMNYGAGLSAAKIFKARPIDPRPYAVGSIKEILLKYARLKDLVPAMGYSKDQVRDLEQTIENTPCEAVLVGTPIDLAGLIKITKPVVRVSYEVADIESPGLIDIIKEFNERPDEKTR